MVLRSTCPQKSLKDGRSSAPRSGTKAESVRELVYNHELVEPNSLSAKTHGVSQSLSTEQHDGVIAISIPGVVPSWSAGAIPSRNPPIRQTGL